MGLIGDAYQQDWVDFLEASRSLCGVLLDEQEQALAEDFHAVLASGKQPRRHYHTVEHYRDVAQAPRSMDEMGSNCSNLQEALHTHQLMEHYAMVTHVMMRAGWHHDVVYAHIDETIQPAIDAQLKSFYYGHDRAYFLQSDPQVSEAERGLYEMALSVFGFYPGQRLGPHDGQNEFLSALYAGLQGQAAGIPEKYLLAEFVMIEATIPFRLPTRMEVLKERLQAANQRLGQHGLTDEEIEAVLLGAVFMANHDVIGFRKPFEQFNRGSHQLLMEAAPTLQTPQGMFDACTQLGDFLGRVGVQEVGGIASVFHSYGGFPVKETREQWDRAAIINCEVQRDRMRSYASTAMLVATVALARGNAQASEMAFCHLFSDASLEPPDHIFPRPMHELRQRLEKADIEFMLDDGTLPRLFPTTPAVANRILLHLRPELVAEVEARLISPSKAANA